MKKVVQMACVALILAVASCETPSQDLVEKLGKSYEYDGQQITLEGYILPLSFTMIKNDLARVELCYGADASRNRVVITDAAEVNFGKSANSIYFEDDAKASSVEIYDRNGARLTYEDKVQLSGSVHYVSRGPKIVQAMREKQEKEHATEEADGNDYEYRIIDVTITKL